MAASPASPASCSSIRAQILTLPCDVLVPAAMERVIDAGVAENLKCRVLAEGANGPTTPDADLVLDKRRDEIFLIPDILCNSGGVVVSYFEWVQDLQQLFWEEEEVMRREYHILDRAFDQMLARAKADNISHRTAAMAIGVEKVRAAKTTRGTVSVITGLDHVVVLVSDIEAGDSGLSDAVCARAGVAQLRRGRRRVLFTLDNMTLELMAPSGDGASRRPDPRGARRAGRGARRASVFAPTTSPKCIAGSIGWR